MKKSYISDRIKLRTQSIVFFLVIGAPFFFLGGPGAQGTRTFAALWDLGHVLFFFLTSWLLCIKYQSRFPDVSGLTFKVGVFLAVLILGVVVEGLQMGFDGRSPDVSDIFRNQLGCLISFALVCSVNSQKRKGLFFIYIFIVTLLAIAALYPLSRGAIDEIIAFYQFPVLSDFETAFESDRWRGKELIGIEEGLARHGNHSLKVQLTTDIYSGVALHFFPGNWKGYENFYFSIYHPDDDQLALVCRIHDSKHNNEYTDRFNRPFVLEKGWNDFSIPLVEIQEAPVNRLQNLEEIENVKFFVVRQEKERTIYIDNIRLGR